MSSSSHNSSELSTRTTTSLTGTSAGSLVKPAKAMQVDQVFATPIAQLTVTILGKPQPLEFPITRAKTTIGRASCDIILDDGIVSSRHMVLYIFANKMVFVEDLGSTNGTFLMSQPPLALDVNTRVQWSDGQTPTKLSIGLGGTGKVALSLSAVRLPDADATPAGAVPATLVDTGDDDDDDAPPPPAFVTFERRTSANKSATEAQPADSAPWAPSPPTDSAAAAADIDATLDYNQALVNSPTAAASDAPQPLGACFGSSESLLGFCASPPNALPVASTASSLGADTKLSPTPPAGLPNTLASTASDHANESISDDESPPPPSSAMRRRFASSETTGVSEVSPAGLHVQATLDVVNVSPAKRALVFDESQSDAAATPACAITAPTGVDADPPVLDAHAAEVVAIDKDAPTVAARRARASSTEQAEGTSVTKRAREPEVDEDDVADRIESSPTQASLVSSSDVVKRRGGARQEPPPPAAVAEGGSTVLPIAPVAAAPSTRAAPALLVKAAVDDSPKIKRRAPPVAALEAATPAPVAAPTPVVAPTGAKWQFKVDLRKAASRDEAWEDYPASDSAVMEAAFLLYDAALQASKKKPKKTLTEVKLNHVYGVHFEDMVQFRFDDRSRQRPVRRKL